MDKKDQKLKPESNIDKSAEGDKTSDSVKTVTDENNTKKETENENANIGQKEKNENQQDEEALTNKYESLSKEELVKTIEELVKTDDIPDIRKHIGYIKVAFRNIIKDESLDEYQKSMQKGDTTAEDEQKADPLKERFDKAFDVYKEKKALHNKELEKQKTNNLKIKEQILDELRGLIESNEELKQTYDKFRELQDKWKDIGPVPQNSKSTLWNNYHFLVEKFFDKVKINKELKDLDLKKNLETKTELCEKAEELLLENSITKSFKKLQKLHEAWKETGPVPKDKKDDIWERFKAATEKLNKRRTEFYKDLREEQEKNYSAKLALCEKAEAIAEIKSESIKEWQKNTEEINELFKVWKTIGFAPREVNAEVWSRFRKAIDDFFKNKRDFFKEQREKQKDNYNKKLNLCVQAEAIKDSDDWKNTTDSLIELQKEWKSIGYVSPKLSNKIWKRFRKACDDFFNRKAEYYANIQDIQKENLDKKLNLIEKVKNFDYSDDKNKNLEDLKAFQREWMEIGHVPIKEKNKIQEEFRKAIDEQFEKLNINKNIKNTLSFQTKIEKIKQSPNSDNKIRKERNYVLNKITELKNNINLWENNIGFFASSKKADVLKSEFQQKINKAKEEINILEEKLKVLKES